MLYKNFKRYIIKDHSDMFQIVCDPSSGSIKLYLTEIRSGSNLHCQTPIKHTTNISELLRISVKYSFILPDDGSHTIQNMSE